jgi:hypothetical protein
MYHKKAPLPPTGDTVHHYDNNEFIENVKESAKDLSQLIEKEI